MTKNNVSFSLALAQEYTSSEEKFPVDFEDAWGWLGYAKKQNAKNKLIKNFEKGIDYIITQVRVNSANQGVQGGRPIEQMFLSIDCFKSLGIKLFIRIYRHTLTNIDKKAQDKLLLFSL